MTGVLRRPPPPGLSAPRTRRRDSTWLSAALVLLAVACAERTGPHTIDSRGGVVEAADGKVLLAVPPGAIKQPIVITVTPASAFPAAEGIVGGTVYDLGPDGIALTRAAVLTIRYEPTAIPLGVPEDSLGLAVVSGGKWQEVSGSSVDVGQNTVTGNIYDLGLYAGLGQPLGHLHVTTPTTGPDPDPDGYAVSVDGTQPRTLGLDDTVAFTNLTAEDHVVELTDVADNCSVSGENPRGVTVPAGDTARTTFTVTCTALLGDLEVSTTTSGPDPDPDGYTVTVDGSKSQAVGSNGTTTFTDL
ncbi:MAG: hypothetical protein GTN78_14330, partial [Gemmatimonadales bacterium]|nr:hypothetical protein [Gemmatimonadales bacterium]NIS65260.1 hypothetical protein [Gemmatimonadales bacterium]